MGSSAASDEKWPTCNGEAVNLIKAEIRRAAKEKNNSITNKLSG
jgi:hypothetical protein